MLNSSEILNSSSSEMLNSDYPHVDRYEELPTEPATGAIYYVDDVPFIFDGFKWWAETASGERIEHYPKPVCVTDFRHCSACTAVMVLTSDPPRIRYECVQCGGGDEAMNELTGLRVDPRPNARTDVLDEAYALIHGDRARQYGDAAESFGRIAGLWSAYLGMVVSVNDVANMMILLKVSRSRNIYQRDSYVDIAGYAALAEKLALPSGSEAVAGQC